MTPKPKKNPVQPILERPVTLLELIDDAGNLIAERRKFPKMCENDVHSQSFQSKLDPYFSGKGKVKDHGTRYAYTKLFNQWT